MKQPLPNNSNIDSNTELTKLGNTYVVNITYFNREATTIENFYQS